MWKEYLNSSKLKKYQKIIMSTAIILGMFTPGIIVNADNGSDPPFVWKMYPYHPPGTVIMFPNDEGAHDTYEYPIEWWYVNFHLIGQTTGNEYGSMVCYFQLHRAQHDNIELRLFTISDIAEGQTYTNRKFGDLSASADHLDLIFAPYDDNNLNNLDFNQYIPSNNQAVYALSKTLDTRATSMSIQMMPWIADTPDIQSTPAFADDDDNGDGGGPIQNDVWCTKTDGDDLRPFQYTLIVSGDAQQGDNQLMELSIDMDCVKPPLMVSGEGIVDLGNDSSYYYTLTKLAVEGTITVNGINEEVNGSAWIDHQWGNFINLDPTQPPVGLRVNWEWFSIKLNDYQEIMVGDLWDRAGNRLGSYSGGLNLVNFNGFLELLDDYTITQLGYWQDPISQKVFSNQWNIIESSHLINLIITPYFDDQMMRFLENLPPWAQQYIAHVVPCTCFWEGACTVSGTINSSPVAGKAYVELTHTYN
jgi:predicted secreted hydrolase